MRDSTTELFSGPPRMPPMGTASDGRATGLFESAVRDLEDGVAPPARSGGVTARDLLVLLKLASSGPDAACADLARELGIATVEASLGLERCRRVGLVDAEKRSVSKPALLGFLEHGLRFVFPAEFVVSGREAPTAAPL